MAKAKKVIRKRVKKAIDNTVENKAVREAAFLKKYGGIEPEIAESDLDKPHFSINQFNEHMNAFAQQSAEVMKATAEQAAREAHIKNFMTVARHMPDNAAVVMESADSAHAIAKALEQLGY